MTAVDYPKTLSLLSSLYICKPSRESLEAWKAALVLDSQEPLSELKKALAIINVDSEVELGELLWEHTRLFIGPYRLPCPPWESVYTSPKRLLMQKAHDEVRELHDEVGLTLNNPDIIADHIGAELNFLAFLLQSAADEPARRDYYSDLAARFLGEHILQWVPQFTRDMEAAAGSDLYKALAKTTMEVISMLKQSASEHLS